jgi:hypothetical protein
MKKIGGFYTGWLDMSSYYYIPEHFYQRYMWFLSLLLVFFILSALIYRLGGGAIKGQERAADSNKTIAKILILSSIIMIILFGLVRVFAYPAFMDSGWFSLGNIIQFQSGKLVIYGVSFYLGIRAYSGKWFSSNNHFWKIHFWGALCFCLFGLNMLVLKNLDAQENPLFIIKLIFCVVYPLWTLSFLGLFLSIGLKYWNHPSKYKRRLSEYSYMMYLVHYSIPFTLPLMLHGLSIPALLKFIITALATLLFSYAAGVLSMKLRRKKSLPLNVE